MYQPTLSEINQTLYNPYSSHPSQYNAGGLPPLYYPPFSHTNQNQLSSPVPDIQAPPPPDLTSVTSEVASRAMDRLLNSELRDASFDSAQSSAVKRLEIEVIAFVEQLFERAHEYANLANRAGAIATDLILACDDLKISPEDLRSVKTKKRSKSNSVLRAPTLLPAPSRSPSPELLPSDDEGAAVVIPLTLRTLPSYYPSLPPKHTYQMTPATPPKKAALPSLEKKLKTACLVQESLKNLMLATEDSANQEDGELLGHIVNWEVGVHPRKRWKISR